MEIEKGELSKEIGFLGALSIGAGAVLGPGEYIVSGEVAAELGPSAVIAFMLAGALMCLTALSYAELGPMMPFAGGSYHFVKEGMGSKLGFLGGWACWIGLITATAFYTIGAARFISNLFLPWLPINLLVVVIVVLFTLINIIGVRMSTVFEIILFLTSLLIIIFFIVFGFPNMQPGAHTPFFAPGKGIPDIFYMAAVITVNFIGFDLVAATAGEIKNPGKNVPLATILSLTMMVIIVALVVWVATGVVNYPEMRGSEVPIALAAKSFAGQVGFTVLSIGGIEACLTGINASLLASSRYLFTLSSEGPIPNKISRVSQTYNTPIIAILVTGLLIGITGLLGDLTITMGLTAAVYLFVFILVNASVILLRRKLPEKKRPFKIPFYPIPPIVGAIACTLLYFQLRIITIIFGFIIIAIGYLMYSWYTQVKNNTNKKSKLTGE